MSEEIKFLYMWMLNWKGTLETLKEWASEHKRDEDVRIGIPGSQGRWYDCQSNDIKDIIGEK